MPTTDETLAKLERRRAFARERQRNYYEANKEKVLSAQKESRKKFTESVKIAYAERNIPLVRNPPERVQRPTQPRPTREPSPPPPHQPAYTLNKKTKEITPVVDFEFVKNNVNTLKIKDGEIISAGSQENYIDTMRDLLRVLNVTSLNTILKNPKKVIDTIENAEMIKGGKYSTNSKRHFSQMILKFIDANFFGKEMKEKHKQPYKDYNDRLNFLSKQKSREKKSYHDIDKYVQKIKEKFGENSKQFIVAMLYKESTRRDDSKLKIVSNSKDADDPKENYLVVPKTRAVCETVINAHKTSSHYDPLVKQLSPYLSNLIRIYMTDENLGYGDNLFSTSTLSRFVSNMSKEIGYDVTITKLRHMAITKFYHSNPSLEEKQKLSNEMGHTLLQQEEYAGNLLDD